MDPTIQLENSEQPKLVNKKKQNKYIYNEIIDNYSTKCHSNRAFNNILEEEELYITIPIFFQDLPKEQSLTINIIIL